MASEMKAARLGSQTYAKPVSHPQAHYTYLIGATTKVKTPLVEPVTQQSAMHRPGPKKRWTWYTVIGVGFIVLKLVALTWRYIVLFVLPIVGVILLLEFLLWLDARSAKKSGWTDPDEPDPYYSEYDQGWMDSWAMHDYGNHDNDNPY